MTEAEWLACDDPTRLLDWLRTPFGIGLRDRVRTTILFGAAFIERSLSGRENSENGVLRRALELADRVPDAEPYITAAHLTAVKQLPSGRCFSLLLEQASRLSPYELTQEAALLAVGVRPHEMSFQHEPRYRAEQAAQAQVLKDIFNPFGPAAISPEWRTDTTITLARTMYESREFGAMPILADALQDAGCDNPDILSHCRSEGTHVRGCWVCDLVLGKE